MWKEGKNIPLNKFISVLLSLVLDEARNCYL